MMKYIFLGVGVILLLLYSKKLMPSTTGAGGPGIGTTPENSTLSSLGGGTSGYPNSCGCKSGASGTIRETVGSNYSPGNSSSGDPLTINSIGQVVSSATGLPPNIFTGGF